jgi:N6-L-threonylcarbamoyladenine synthase
MKISKKYLLAIESTAHTFGVAVLDFDKNILANLTSSWVSKSGGMIPIEVRKHHKKVSEKLFKQALKKANITEEKIEIIALSTAPGLAPCLLEGMKFAKKLATKLQIPIVGVNHCIAHLEIGEITGAKDPVLIYASGANTQIIAYEAGKYRIFGETLDLGIGNFIDTIGRYFKLGFPGGPKIEKLAKACKRKNELIELAYSVKGMDVSFSGIQTQIKNLYDKKVPIEDLAYSLQETVFAMLTEVAERALAHTGKKELLLGGGVACNTRLKEMCKIMCEKRGVKFFYPQKHFLVDNAAMIGYLGLKMHKKGLSESNLEKIDIKPRERTDEVQVIWK